MNTIPRKNPLATLLASAFAGLWAATALAQTPADSTETSSSTKVLNEDAPLVLSPFTVTTEKDKGYKATNATSGTRLNTPIKDLPLPLTVVTDQFIRDTGALDLRRGLAYTAGIQLQSQNDQGTPGGAYQGPGGVNNPEAATANSTGTNYKIRGYIT
ncbi:MAG: hypothetical protein C0502_09265, partial [Opitutus sp.]|nr:hypothetical protein [Opitutus sp.]